MVDDLIVGNAVQEAEQGMQMGRMIALTALGIDVAGMVINRYCGSGVEAIHLASAKIQAGMADCIIAGGAESMSLVPVMGSARKPAIVSGPYRAMTASSSVAQATWHEG